MSIGNIYDREKVTLACIFCGNTDLLGLVSHRNENEKIVGFIFVCESCEKKGELNDKQIIIEKINKDAPSQQHTEEEIKTAMENADVSKHLSLPAESIRIEGESSL